MKLLEDLQHILRSPESRNCFEWGKERKRSPGEGGALGRPSGLRLLRTILSSLPVPVKAALAKMTIVHTTYLQPFLLIVVRTHLPSPYSQYNPRISSANGPQSPPWPCRPVFLIIRTIGRAWESSEEDRPLWPGRSQNKIETPGFSSTRVDREVTRDVIWLHCARLECYDVVGRNYVRHVGHLIYLKLLADQLKPWRKHFFGGWQSLN